LQASESHQRYAQLVEVALCMDNTPKWRRLFPNWRHWVTPPALLAPVSGFYWAWISVSALSEASIAWQFFAFGVALSVLGWWTVAYSGSETDRATRELREEVRQAKEETARGDERLERQAKEYQEAKMAQGQSTHEVVVAIQEQLTQAHAANASPLTMASLESALTIAQQVEAGQPERIPEALLGQRHRSDVINRIIGGWWGEEFPAQVQSASTQQLRSLLIGVQNNPPTDPNIALAVSKELSSLSQAIPNKTTSQTIAEQVASTTMQSRSSSGAHRPPESSS
jgi:hypothetical protein